jgi:hypothetical protein
VIKFLFLLFVVVLVALPQPLAWFNLPYLLGVVLIFAVSFRSMFWVLVAVLTLADILNLRPLGFSLILVGASAYLCWWLYQKFLPHNKWAFGFSILAAYLLAVAGGPWLASYI